MDHGVRAVDQALIMGFTGLVATLVIVALLFVFAGI